MVCVSVMRSSWSCSVSSSTPRLPTVPTTGEIEGEIERGGGQIEREGRGRRGRSDEWHDVNRFACKKETDLERLGKCTVLFSPATVRPSAIISMEVSPTARGSQKEQRLTQNRERKAGSGEKVKNERRRG